MQTEAIQQAIRESEIGDKLSEIVRWSRFLTGQTKEEWTAFLGPTAVVLTHQERFLEFASPHLLNELQNGRFTVDEYERLRRALAIHDVGEATAGDIPAPLKNDESEKKEFLHALQNLQKLNLSEENLTLLEQDYREVIMGDNAALHYFFKAMERIEYLDTAYRAFLSLQKGLPAEKGGELISEALSFSIPSALNYARQLPLSVGVFLVNLEKEFNQMFEFSAVTVSPENAETFPRARELWEKFKPELKKNLGELVRSV